MKLLIEDFEQLHEELALSGLRVVDNIQDDERLRRQHEALIEVLNDAVIVPPDVGAVVGIGDTVHYKRSGARLTVHLGGEWVSTERTDLGWARCTSPIGVALLGASVGETRRLRLGHKTIDITVTDIEGVRPVQQSA